MVIDTSAAIDAGLLRDTHNAPADFDFKWKERRLLQEFCTRRFDCREVIYYMHIQDAVLSQPLSMFTDAYASRIYQYMLQYWSTDCRYKFTHKYVRYTHTLIGLHANRWQCIIIIAFSVVYLRLRFKVTAWQTAELQVQYELWAET